MNKTYYRVDIALYVEIDTEEQIDAVLAADYLSSLNVLPFAVGYQGFRVQTGEGTMTVKMLERIPKIFKNQPDTS